MIYERNFPMHKAGGKYTNIRIVIHHSLIFTDDIPKDNTFFHYGSCLPEIFPSKERDTCVCVYSEVRITFIRRIQISSREVDTFDLSCLH